METPGASEPAARQPVIGLEVHAQLSTASKMFCACPTAVGASPNTQTCPTCLGLPGALPVVNERAVDLGVLVALALGCTVAGRSRFARKNYFYPDLPKGYQITQYDEPLASGGLLSWPAGSGVHDVSIVRVHLEEDAGKSFHTGFEDSASSAYIDFNRSGVPLIEIVTGPDLASPADAAECMRRLRAILVAVGASTAVMEEGGLRCDANVSLRRADGSHGTRVEIKNLNSFRALQRALEHEIARQSRILEAGGTVAVETRLWDEGTGRTVAMRTKEESEDYRYFPEPDLPPLALPPERIARLRESLPELPEARRLRLSSRYGLNDEDAAALAATPSVASFFEAVASACSDPAAACVWIRGELARRLSETGLELDTLTLAPADLGRLIQMVSAGALSASAAKSILSRMVETGEGPDAIASAEGLLQESDADSLRTLVHDTLASHPEQVRQYRRGKREVAGFLVGLVMKRSHGRANPAIVARLVRARLDEPEL